MTSRDEALTDPVVDALLARLGEAGRSQDPVPAAVLANAAAALELRDLDTALAALVADSDDVDDSSPDGRLRDVRQPVLQIGIAGADKHQLREDGFEFLHRIDLPSDADERIFGGKVAVRGGKRCRA